MSDFQIQNQLRGMLQPVEQGSKPQQPMDIKTEEGKSFSDLVGDSIIEVNRLQQEANTSMEQMATGEKKDIHDTVIAMQKASISFKMMMEVRNKLVDAYKEVMRTQV